MSPPNAVHGRELERQGRRMIRPALRFLAIALLLSGGVARWAARHRLFA